MDPTAPLVVELRRGPHVESRHVVHAVAVDASGQLLRAWGDAGRLTHPRSAVKPIQALPLVETGAADAFSLGDAELALACASHNGETAHVAAVDAWLARIGCSHRDLECGVQEGRGSTASGNNCSGKHTGFLTVARHLDVPTQGYIEADHPVQQLVTATLAETTGTTIDPADRGIDGCGIPVHPLPLSAIARGAAALGAPPDDWQPGRRGAAHRLTGAMVHEPWYVAGTGRACTELMEACGDELVVKVGAQGVQLAAVPRSAVGVALKVEDGERRASEVALGHVLAAVAPELTDRIDPVIEVRRVVTNHARTVVGRLEVVAA